MKARLLFEDRDVELEQPLPPHADALEQDLGLDALLDAMGAADAYLRDRAERTLLNGLADPAEILYRQEALNDCLRDPVFARELYALAVEALDCKQKAHFFWFRDSPDQQLHKSLTMLDLLLDVLRRLRALADREVQAVESRAFRALLGTLQRELDDVYLEEINAHLRELRFRRGPLISAQLGRANRATGYVLRKPNSRSFLERVTPGGPSHYSFSVPPRDEHGAQTLADLRGRGISRASNAVAQATDHVVSFFTMLRAELGFYVACLNLHQRLAGRGEPTAFPSPRSAPEVAFSARGLYDAGLAFHLDGRVVGNDVNADAKPLVMITGANQGGKSTFLRSVGIAQLMMQAGMFVPAESFSASVGSGLYTHFKREEDASMTHGKLDEELNRMSGLMPLIEPAGILLCNESFASTNEAEGSEIARQLIRALREGGVRVFFVSHLYDLAHGLCEEQRPDALFLRAERGTDGNRPFRVTTAPPLPTSFGADSYRRIFGKPLMIGDDIRDRAAGEGA